MFCPAFRRRIFPAVSAFSGNLASTIAAKKSVIGDLDCAAEESLLRKIAALLSQIAQENSALEEVLAGDPGKDAYEAAQYCRRTVFAAMERLRSSVDTLESLVAADYWPLPSYTDLLFSIK